MGIRTRIEHFVDKSIPYLLVVLVAIVVIDIFFTKIAAEYHTLLYWLDAIVIALFVADLTFKYARVRNIPSFLKLYWLDILAVFPFFLVLRFFEELLLISEKSMATLRSFFHAGVIFQEEIMTAEEAAKIAKSSELLAKEGRLALLSDFIRPLRRIPRFFKAVSFYEHPGQKETLYHKHQKYRK